METKRIAVLGIGTMGSGIAQVCAQAGFEVVVRDVSDEALARGLAAIEKSLGRLARSGKLSEQERAAALGRIRTTTAIEQAADADYVIEAVPEILALKLEIFTALDRLCRPGVILASNTSELSVTALAAATNRPERVIGMHWFNPPPLMRLIEIVRALQTSDETLRITQELSAALGKQTVVCKDAQGFITSRALAALVFECVRIYEEGLASKEDIDKAIRLGLNHPMGPFELADFVGIDVLAHIGANLREALGERMLAPQTLCKLYEAGRLGRKSGHGFYEYSP
jgi:3-hydroxybutyryl-CoA dehydrogenase